MTKERLEFYLNRKNVFGYNTENDDKIVGWITVFKRFPTEGFFERHVEIAGSKRFQEQMKIKSEPYRVNVQRRICINGNTIRYKTTKTIIMGNGQI